MHSRDAIQQRIQRHAARLRNLRRFRIAEWIRQCEPQPQRESGDRHRQLPRAQQHHRDLTFSGSAGHFQRHVDPDVQQYLEQFRQWSVHRHDDVVIRAHQSDSGEPIELLLRRHHA